MKITELLREYNEQRLINDFGNKLVIRYENEFHTNISPNQIIEKRAALDPTPNKEFAFWLCLNYANNNPKYNGGIRRFEDISSRAIPALEKFKALLRKPNLNPPLVVRDINQIRGLSQLENIIEQYGEKETTSSSEQASKEEQQLVQTNQAKILYNDNQIKVLIPETQKASCFFGKGTRWCTAATKNNMFSSYAKPNDPLYIIIIKGTNEKYQVHYGTGQFMNANDEPIDPNELADRYPILWKIFTPIAEKHHSLILNAHPSEKVQLAAVNQDGHAIEYIKDPSEKAKKIARKNKY